MLQQGNSSTLLRKQKRKLPRRNIVDAELVSSKTDSARIMDDLLLPSERDRIILSEIFDGNTSSSIDSFHKLPRVILGVPNKRQKIQKQEHKTYKERLKENGNTADFFLDLSSHSIIPPSKLAANNKQVISKDHYADSNESSDRKELYNHDNTYTETTIHELKSDANVHIPENDSVIEDSIAAEKDDKGVEEHVIEKPEDTNVIEEPNQDIAIKDEDEYLTTEEEATAGDESVSVDSASVEKESATALPQNTNQDSMTVKEQEVFVVIESYEFEDIDSDTSEEFQDMELDTSSFVDEDEADSDWSEYSVASNKENSIYDSDNENSILKEDSVVNNHPAVNNTPMHNGFIQELSKRDESESTCIVIHSPQAVSDEKERVDTSITVKIIDDDSSSKCVDIELPPKFPAITQLSQAIKTQTNMEKGADSSDNEEEEEEWMDLDDTKEQEDDVSEKIFQMMSVNIPTAATKDNTKKVVANPQAINKHKKLNRLRSIKALDWMENITMTNSLHMVDRKSRQIAHKRQGRLCKKRQIPYVTRKKIKSTVWK